MSRKFSTPLLSPVYPKPPYHYIGSKLFLALFNPTDNCLKKLLPPELRPSDLKLAGLMFAQQPCKEAGTFMESGVLVQCVFDNPETKQEEVGVYFPFEYADTDVAIAAGREIWGYPRKLAKISLDVRGDKVVATTARGGKTLLKATCTLTDEGEWIESGPNVNIKMIPSIDGKGSDVATITSAHLTYDVKKGRSGTPEIEVNSGPQDDLSMIELENVMMGLYFDVDITVPLGKVIKKLSP
jgi:acetoacetate decarboxylase